MTIWRLLVQVTRLIPIILLSLPPFRSLLVPFASNPFSRDVHVIGIRSKTKLTAKVLKEAKNLLVIGCFCIGTNQVDLEFAARQGIAVFNSPFANSRSVAELVIAEIITLARQLGDRSNEMHNGTWNKVSAKCWEVRGKTLGSYSPPPVHPQGLWSY